MAEDDAASHGGRGYSRVGCAGAMQKTRSTSDAVLRELRAFALACPAAHTKSAWPGHLDVVATLAP
jgi:hypothetical protein